VLRVGIGYDIHRMRAGRTLVLGGVTIDHDIGLDGHSDADVLIHAIMDALLGAAALGDIGVHFPPTDERYRDADSMELLKRVHDLLKSHGWRPQNVDSTVVAERPLLRPHIEPMRRNIAKSLGLSLDAVSVKATTHERLGAVGREEGISATAIASITMVREPA
jgi:2-C-methyl-D-erythritol 2,4-cyclodiphosphate synthase